MLLRQKMLDDGRIEVDTTMPLACSEKKAATLTLLWDMPDEKFEELDVMAMAATCLSDLMKEIIGEI